MANEHPSTQTWQADVYVTSAILGEIIAALDIDEKIDWQSVVDSAQGKCDDQMRGFIQQTVNGIRVAVSNAKTNGPA